MNAIGVAVIHGRFPKAEVVAPVIPPVSQTRRRLLRGLASKSVADQNADVKRQGPGVGEPDRTQRKGEGASSFSRGILRRLPVHVMVREGERPEDKDVFA